MMKRDFYIYKGAIMLTIDHLYFSYTGKEPWLLEDISLHVPKGSYISIVGNNGSGKSTLLKLILGFLHPTKGSIRCQARRIGYVPQMPGRDQAFPITVREVIHSYGKLLRLKSFSVKEILSATGMEDYENELMGRLSGGQHQRVLIARALMGNPDLLILDEPSTGVDLMNQKEIYRELSRLNREHHLTVLAVEHNMEEAGKVSTSLYHVDQGHGHLCSVSHYIEEYIEKEGGHVQL
ncbi:metal ABC transporter ATP-binding protein [Dialister sp.]|uniref:metal ABC transporter ATP-binding protein n=1 Tax=Dialister sp. TaxID=1955814 RepID=UPI003A5C1DD1